MILNRLGCADLAHPRPRSRQGAAGATQCLADFGSDLLKLAQGCRNQQELQRSKRGLTRKNTEIIPITPAICERAMGLIDAYALSEGLQLADALIAATAIECQLTLLTANTKHFSAIQGLSVEAFVP